MNLAKYIDHTILAAESNIDDVKKVVCDAIKHEFASVCVNSCYIELVVNLLQASIVKSCAVVGFPLGAMAAEVKAKEASFIAKCGGDEIDFVAHLPNLLNKDLDSATKEFTTIVNAAKAINPKIVVKVIIESALLLKESDEESIAIACQAAKMSGCDFVKTSTGFHKAGGASIKAVQLMKKHNNGLLIKASGFIRTKDDAIAMINAGANRLGCSASIQIVS